MTYLWLLINQADSPVKIIDFIRYNSMNECARVLSSMDLLDGLETNENHVGHNQLKHQSMLQTLRTLY